MCFRKILQKRKQKRDEIEAFKQRLLLKITNICNLVDDEYFETISRQEVIDKTFNCFKRLDCYMYSEQLDYRLTRFILWQTNWLEHCMDREYAYLRNLGVETQS